MIGFRSGFGGVHRRLNRTAIIMPHDKDKMNIQFLHCILNTCNIFRIKDISRNSNHEKIPEPLIKNNFWRNPRVGTRKNNRKRFLFPDQLFSFRISSNKPLISAFQLLNLSCWIRIDHSEFVRRPRNSGGKEKKYK